MSIAKPPFTVEQLQRVLSALNYYELSIQCCLDCIKKFNDLAFYREHLQRNKTRRDNALKLLDYCETDFDRKLLTLRYIYCEDCFTIAHEMAYSDRMIYNLLKRALERLSENTKKMPEFEY